MESQTSSGLAVIERALRPEAPTAVSADAGVMSEASAPVVTSSSPLASGPPPLRPSRWAGWPAEWADPMWSNWWGRLEELTDTAWACLDLNAAVLASMPPYLVDAAPSLDAEWLINPDPWEYSDWSEFAKQLFWDFQLGEAYVMPTAYYQTGWPRFFHVVPPHEVTVEFDSNGLRRYRIGRLDVTASILAIRYTSKRDQPRGRGPLEVGRARLVAANALNRYATELAVSGGIPYAVLVHPGELTAEQSSDLRWQWVDKRIAAMGLPGVLSGGIDLKTLSIDPEKMAWLDLTRFMESRIAVLLGVPPPLVALPSGQDSLTYNTAVMIREQHWQAGLKPKADRVMRALTQWALPRGTSIELNRDEYVRPAPLERAQTNQILFDNGIITREEWREMERFSNAAPSETLTSGVLQ